MRTLSIPLNYSYYEGQYVQYGSLLCEMRKKGIGKELRVLGSSNKLLQER